MLRIAAESLYYKFFHTSTGTFHTISLLGEMSNTSLLDLKKYQNIAKNTTFLLRNLTLCFKILLAAINILAFQKYDTYQLLSSTASFSISKTHFSVQDETKINQNPS
jgi:hypothetical protein